MVLTVASTPVRRLSKMPTIVKFPDRWRADVTEKKNRHEQIYAYKLCSVLWEKVQGVIKTTKVVSNWNGEGLGKPLPEIIFKPKPVGWGVFSEGRGSRSLQTDGRTGVKALQLAHRREWKAALGMELGDWEGVIWNKLGRLIKAWTTTQSLGSHDRKLKFFPPKQQKAAEGWRGEGGDETSLKKLLCDTGKDGMKKIQGTCWEEMSMGLMRGGVIFLFTLCVNLSKNRFHRLICLNMYSPLVGLFGNY